MKVLKIFPKQFRLYCLGLFSAACFAGTVYISPSEDPYTEIQEALILASPGDVIHLSAGLYELEDSLSIDVNNLILEGEGINDTVHFLIQLGTTHMLHFQNSAHQSILFEHE